MNKEQNKETFPPTKNGEFVMIENLSKREYFAGCALQGLLSIEVMPYDIAANYAVKAADYLIEELNK